MPRSRRYFLSEQLYAITFRIRRGLPLVTTRYMELLLSGILARTQRDNKVTLCHDLWMPNHPHLLVVGHDAQALVNFYAEIQKRITDCLKRLLRSPQLSLWEGRPVVARIADLEAAIGQVVYLYANPGRANLVESIEEYPGRNSYEIFKECASTPELGANRITKAFWIPPSKIPSLPSRKMTPHLDADFASALQELGECHELRIEPNAWMRCFGIETPEAIAEVNAKILERLKERESEFQKARKLERRQVLGAKGLRRQPIDKDHKPKKGERRVYLISSEKELRRALIVEFQALCDLCRECFKACLQGLRCEWPPGMFRPPLRPVASAIACGGTN